jgi:aspartate/methionine/tyrosine aminotransferase
MVPMREFALEAYFARWERSVRHNLAASESEPLMLPDLLDLADEQDRERWECLTLGYGDTLGASWLRRTIAGLYDEIDRQEVLCFTGAQEGIYCAMHALLARTDHAIVITPGYQSAETVPLSLCEVTGVPLDPAQGWTLDIDAVAHAIRPNTRVISINFPNNPTGKILAQDQFDALVALCRRHGLWLFSDEVYRLIERDPAHRLPAAVDAYERGLSLNVMSKAYGLPGLRLGWIACRDAGMLYRMGQVKQYLSISNAAPSEVLADIALKAGERILSRNRRIAGDNLLLLQAFFDEFPDLFEWHCPEGGVTGYPRYKGSDGVEAFAARLIEEEGVLVLPASVFRSDLLTTPADRFRVGFGRSGMASGLDALRRHLRRQGP